MQNGFKKDLTPDESNEQLFGFYRAVVLDNRDRAISNEGKTYGRIKVNIPSIMDDQETGIWAYPGNNPMGGRNTEDISSKKNSNGGKQEFSGCMIVPPNNSWVWVFFENGDPNRPYYFNGVDIKAHEAPPEIQVNNQTKPEERWLIFRSPHGRVIMISDDPDNCRVEITGKKRVIASNSDGHVYSIVGNQKTILIDDREGKEKILLEDEKGNFININTAQNDIDVHANNIIRVNAGNAMYFSAPHMGFYFNTISTAGGNVSCNVSGNFSFMTNGNTSIRANGSLFMDSPNLKTNSGSSASPGTDGSQAATPANGDRK